MTAIEALAWLPYGVTCAFFYASSGAQAKRLLGKVDPVVVMFASAFFAIPLTLPFALAAGIAAPDRGFWWALIAGIALNGVGYACYTRALLLSDLSLVVPLLALTPVWMLATSPWILGEFPAALGVIGILAIFVGALLLKFGEPGGVWAPLRAIVRDRGARFMIAVSLLWSITAALDKVAVQAASPTTYILAFQVGFSLLFLPAVLRKERRTQIRAHWRGLLLLGCLGALMLVAQMTALPMTLAAYVIAMKRSGMLFSILYGHYLFNEQGIRQRLVGAGAMIVGMFLLAAGSVRE